MVAVGLPVPDAPASLTAMPGVGEAELEWTAAPDDGGSPVTGSSFASVNSVRRQQRMVREDVIRRNTSRQAVVVALSAFLPNPLAGQRATTVSPTLPGETTSPDTVTSAMADNHRNEIGYAAACGKPVRYVTDEPDLLARITRTEER